MSKKIMALVLTLLMVTSLFGALPAFAANEPAGNDDVQISVVKSGDGVDLKIAGVPSGKALSSADFIYTIDSSAFQYESYTTDFDGKVYNQNNQKFVLYSSVDDVSGNVATIHFSKLAAFDAVTPYEFKVKFTSASYGDFSTPAWAKTTYTVTYQEETPVASYTVTFDSDGGSAVAAQTVKENGTASKPADPTKEGFTFAGWLLNGAPYDFSTPVTGAITLVASWTEVPSNAIDLSGIKIVKVVNASEGAAVDQDFTFKFTPVNGAPAIADVVIHANAAGEFTGALAAVVFEKGGVYKYVVEEAADPNAADWSFDTAKYDLSIEIEENSQDGKLALGDVVIQKQGDSQKTDSMEFTNTLSSVTSLVVTKTVKGEGDNPMFKDKEFSFTVNFTGSGDPITVTKTAKDGTVTNLDNAVYGADYTFTLKDGEQVKFDNVAAGTAYTLKEAGTEYYTASAVVTTGGVQADKAQDGEYAKDFTVSGTAAVGANQVDVTNTYSITPPTGLVMHTELWLVIGFAFIAALGYLFIARRRREND